MALLEYATRVVPDVVKKKATVSFYSNDPFMKQMRSRNRVKRSGGTVVRFQRVLGEHSNITEINGSSIQVDLTRLAALGTSEGNWARYVKPIILLHQERDRMTSRDQVKQWIDDLCGAALVSMQNEVMRQIYIGNSRKVRGIGTLNGNVSGLTSTGLERGALRFETPAAQDAGGLSYLGATRSLDTVDFVDNWHNQYAQHGGIGTNALRYAAQVTKTANTYAETGAASLGILSIDDHTNLEEEIRSNPGGGGQAAVVYTADDVDKGRVQAPITMAGGVTYYPNRWMTAANMSATEAIMYLNPDAVEYWVNANNDFRTTKFKDFMETMGVDADVGFIFLEVQFGVINPLACACISA